MYKPTINTSYKGVCRLYETCGRSGYRDVTAERAIRKTDKQPQEVTDLVEIFKKIAELQGYEIHGRIGFKNKHTGIIYK